MERRSPQFLPYAVGVAGATGIFAQTVFMRELVVAFYGNELTTGFLLGIWLLGTAFGSGLLGRWLVSERDPLRSFTWAQFVAALFMLVSLTLVRLSPPIFGRTPGEISDLVPLFLAPLFWVFPFCAVLGFLFTAAVRALEHHRVERSAASEIGWTYFAESVGASVGGLLVSFLLLRWLNSFQIIGAASVLNLGSAAYLWLQTGGRAQAGLSVVLIVGTVFFPRMDKLTLQRVWKGMDVTAVGTSVYGQTVVTSLGPSTSFYVNGLLMFTWPDYLTAEQVIHIPLLEHPQPRRVLLIGGGVGGLINEILKHPNVEHVDYVELDPTIIELARRTLPDSVVQALSDPRVSTHNVDGRRFLKITSRRYDVIIVNLPNPHNVQVNRFYTVEFFREAEAKLAPGGLLAFEVTSSENAIGSALAEFLRCLQASLSQVFKRVVVLPGETNAFLASNADGYVTDEADLLVRRLVERRIRTTYVREYYLPYRLSDERKAYLAEQLETVQQPTLNRDLRPVAYYFDVTLWSTLFTQSLRTALRFVRDHGNEILAVASGVLLAICLLLAAREWRRRRDLRTLPVVMTILVVGFSEISVEVMAIVSFQAIFGYAYYELALLVTAYMIGLTVGSFFGTRLADRLPSPRFQAVLAQAAFVLLLLGFLGILAWAPHVSPATAAGFLLRIAFPILLGAAGSIGGYQFPVANAILLEGKPTAGEQAGFLYGTDLAGSSLGALLTSAFFVPIAGIPNTLVGLALLNALSLALLVAAWRGVKWQE